MAVNCLLISFIYVKKTVVYTHC